MKIFKLPKDIRAWTEGKQVGFVPTMGFLHEGHLALVRRAKRENDFVVVSIFVNPTQFCPNEDFNKYPRNLKRDLTMLRKEKVDAVFVPTTAQMYPEGVKAKVKAGPVSRPLEGIFRPGHFDGVCGIVKILFEVINPEKAYFGQKDFQQTKVVQEMVDCLKLPVKLVICPTVREKDGLAKSSRNGYLSLNERAIAPVLHNVLCIAKKEILAKGKPATVEKTAIGVLTFSGFKVQYFCIADARTLKSLKVVKKFKGRIVIAVAAFLGKTRLIDNVVFSTR